MIYSFSVTLTISMILRKIYYASSSAFNELLLYRVLICGFLQLLPKEFILHYRTLHILVSGTTKFNVRAQKLIYTVKFLTAFADGNCKLNYLFENIFHTIVHYMTNTRLVNLYNSFKYF